MNSEVKTMRTLEEIREQNRRKDNMFFEGMEEKPVDLDPETIKEGRGFFEKCVKPTAQRAINKLIKMGYIE